jgi:hypothetical protein
VPTPVFMWQQLTEPVAIDDGNARTLRIDRSRFRWPGRQ